MIARSPSQRPLFASLAVLITGALPASADQIFIAGAAGEILKADARTEVFAPFACACRAAITALTTDGRVLIVGDAAGTIQGFSLDGGTPLYSYSVPVIPSALAVYHSQLFVAGSAGSVLHLEASTGIALSDSRAVPTQINAMALRGDDVYIAGVDGAIYTAKATGGSFTFFASFSFTSIATLATVGKSLYVGDSAGALGEVDLETGSLVNSFPLLFPFNAMAPQGPDLLVHGGGGLVSRINRKLGEAEDYYFSPIPITAMLVVRERSNTSVLEPLSKPAGILKR